MMRGVGHVPMHDDPDVARVLLQGSAPVAEVAPLAAASVRRDLAPQGGHRHRVIAASPGARS